MSWLSHRLLRDVGRHIARSGDDRDIFFLFQHVSVSCSGLMVSRCMLLRSSQTDDHSRSVDVSDLLNCSGLCPWSKIII